MSVLVYRGNIILPDRILYDGTVSVSNGVIIGVSEQAYMHAGSVIDYSGRYIAPGFVDIHCHGSPDCMCHIDPVRAAKTHYKKGTTAMLCSLYRNLDIEQTLNAIDKIKHAMKESGNIIGVHMEGPYLNPSLGSKAGDSVKIKRDEYLSILRSGVIKQWTFAPEIEGSEEFCREIVSYGIVPAIGHSEASIEQVRQAVNNGARIVTHLLNATGCSKGLGYAGTKDVDFDAACMLSDGLYYELILDSGGVHVRHDMARLVIKTVGIDRVVGITDCYTGTDDGLDVNFVGDEITGSKLTMDGVARNFLKLGLSLTEVFGVTAYNPAKAIRMEKQLGSINVGCRADLILTDSELKNIEVIRSK